MPVTAVTGIQWGDEGKGKIVDLLAPEYDYIVRCHGGNNAGHTMIVQGKRIITHLIPSGFANRNATLVVGTGMVVHLSALVQEIRALERAGFEIRSRLKISDRTHVILPAHIAEDKRRESNPATRIGTTQQGIGPAYSAKALRDGVRIGDFLTGFASGKIIDFAEEFRVCREAFEMIRSCVCDTTALLQDAVAHGSDILLEGAHGTMLDLDHGTYPWVTSSTTTTNGLLGGAGLNPFQLTHAVGVAKAYCTRVGDGPFPSEMNANDTILMRKKGNEFGSTTGRPRRCGWFDAVAIRYAIALNGIREVFLTKLDVLSGFPVIMAAVGYRINGEIVTQFPSDLNRYANFEVVYQQFDGWDKDITHCRTYADLPSAARTYVEWIVSQCDIPVRISVGPHRDQMIMDR